MMQQASETYNVLNSQVAFTLVEVATVVSLVAAGVGTRGLKAWKAKSEL